MSKHCKNNCIIVEQKPGDILTACCCYNDRTAIGADITGGWSNSTFPCDNCKEGDLVAKWKMTHDGNTPRSYSMTGLSDTCDTNNSFQEIDFAFYSIIRTDVAVPYWVVYIYESGTNRSWFSYDRGDFIPECREFEIRREGGQLIYLVDGNPVRSVTDTTNGACLYLDDSWHGSLNTGVVTRSQTSLCQLETVEDGNGNGNGNGNGRVLNLPLKPEAKGICLDPEHEPTWNGK